MFSYPLQNLHVTFTVLLNLNTMIFFSLLLIINTESLYVLPMKNFGIAEPPKLEENSEFEL